MQFGEQFCKRHLQLSSLHDTMGGAKQRRVPEAAGDASSIAASKGPRTKARREKDLATVKRVFQVGL